MYFILEMMYFISEMIYYMSEMMYFNSEMKYIISDMIHFNSEEESYIKVFQVIKPDFKMFQTNQAMSMEYGYYSISKDFL